MPQTLIFDLDGTLTDPKIGITHSIVYALEKLGLNAPHPEELTWCIGPPLAGSFAKLLETDDHAKTAHAVQLYRERFADIGMFENEVYEGIPEALGQLHLTGYRLFVATSKPQVYAQRILEHFELADCFEAIYGSELDGTRADKGDLLGYLIEQERITPSDSAMIGDREHDILGAARVSMQGIGVLYGYGSLLELQQAGAAVLCQTPSEIPGIVESMKAVSA